MQAPDKIYIPIRFKDTDRLAPTWWQEPIEGYTNIAYIRKDALLEWAKERLHHYAQYNDDAVCWGQRNAFQQVIDKLNSL